MSHTLTEAPWWRRVLTLEPALVRGAAALVVLVGTNVGLNIGTEVDRVVTVVLAILAFVPLVQAWWTRSAVYAGATVVQAVTPKGEVVTGPAAVVPGIVLSRVKNERGRIYPLDAERDDLA